MHLCEETLSLLKAYTMKDKIASKGKLNRAAFHFAFSC